MVVVWAKFPPEKGDSGILNPDYALGSVMRAKNARKSSI
jgi:hypothetical protein